MLNRATAKLIFSLVFLLNAAYVATDIAHQTWADGIVPYELTGNFTEKDVAYIKKAIDKFHENTCIRFVKRVPEREKLYIDISSKKPGCMARTGKNWKGPTDVILGYSYCRSTLATAMHEIMHGLGFIHEHCRPDRDEYIEVIYDNVMPDYKYMFKKRPEQFLDVGVEYDYESIMHYVQTSFTKNGHITMKPKKQTEAAKKMGLGKDFSASDIEKLNRVYNCGSNPKETAKKRLNNYFSTKPSKRQEIPTKLPENELPEKPPKKRIINIKSTNPSIGSSIMQSTKLSIRKWFFGE